MNDVLSVHVGAQLWFEGQRWSVAELKEESVCLSTGRAVRQIRLSDLIGRAVAADDGHADPAGDEGEAVDLTGSVVLSALSPMRRAAAERRAVAINSLIQRTGHLLAEESVRDVADELGVSTRTVRRLVNQYRMDGVAGLVDARTLQESRPSVDPAWDAICRETLASYRDRSNPTMKTVIAGTTKAFQEAYPGRRVPTRSVAYARVRELDRGRYTFGAAKQRRSVADRPAGVLGRLRAQRPGQFVVMDTTRLDVHAMEPVSLRWVNTELTVAMDVYSRCITGVSLRPVAATSIDAASVLYQTMTPQRWGRASDDPVGPYLGVPENVWSETGVVPDTMIVDHGKIYLSRHLLSVCNRLGINVQPAIPHKPTDKPWVERFFRTLRQSLLEHLPAYKGPDVASRGKDVEAHAFLYVPELEQIIREWVGIYHATPHEGLCDPHLPQVELSPREMFARGLTQSGLLRLPSTPDVAMEFLETAWRKIHHYGVEIHGRRYDGAGLNLHRGVRSSYGGAYAGKWPFLVDRDDVRWVFFKDPTEGTWHRLEWEHAPGLNAPFSADAAEFTRRLSVREHRFVEPNQALSKLLADWSVGQVTDRRDRNLAIRLATQRAEASDPINGDSSIGTREQASVPGVIDLFTRRNGATAQEEPVSDDLDVFDDYYAKHPDGGLEVFE